MYIGARLLLHVAFLTDEDTVGFSIDDDGVGGGDESEAVVEAIEGVGLRSGGEDILAETVRRNIYAHLAE